MTRPNNGQTPHASSPHIPLSPPRILYVVHRVPYPPDKGDRIRAYHVLRYLRQHAAVYLACLADEPVPEEVRQELHRCCEKLAIVPVGRVMRWVRGLGWLLAGGTVSQGVFHSPPLSRILESWSANTAFHGTLASASSVAPYLQLPQLGNVPSVVDLVDVDSQKWLDYARASHGLRGWVYRTEGRRLRREEQRCARWAQALTVVSEAEAALLRDYCPPEVVHVVPNGVDLETYQPTGEQEEPATVVFVGAMDYRPNVDAVCWFAREIWPTLRNRHPQAQFRIVGRRPTADVQALHALPGVEVLGQVADVRPYLSRATLSVAPLRIARGVQNKVLEALALAKAVVASPQALAGLPCQQGVPARCARSPQEWVELVSQLFEDAELRRDLGREGRQYVERNHRWEKCLRPLSALLGLSHDMQETRSTPAGISGESE